MTVKELIEILLTFNEDWEIRVLNLDSITSKDDYIGSEISVNKDSGTILISGQ